jgi:hypothetical protein
MLIDGAPQVVLHAPDADGRTGWPLLRIERRLLAPEPVFPE